MRRSRAHARQQLDLTGPPPPQEGDRHAPQQLDLTGPPPREGVRPASPRRALAPCLPVAPSPGTGGPHGRRAPRAAEGRALTGLPATAAPQGAPMAPPAAMTLDGECVCAAAPARIMAV